MPGARLGEQAAFEGPGGYGEGERQRLGAFGAATRLHRIHAGKVRHAAIMSGDGFFQRGDCGAILPAWCREPVDGRADHHATTSGNAATVPCPAASPDQSMRWPLAVSKKCSRDGAIESEAVSGNGISDERAATMA